MVDLLSWRISDAEFNIVNMVAEMDAFAYTGYDPRIISAVLLEYANRDMNVLKRDMSVIITFYLTRGARIKRGRILDTMSERGRELITSLREKYKIKDGIHEIKAATGLGQKTVTIPRIIGCFAHIIPGIIRRMDEHTAANNLPPIRIVGEHPNFPRALSFPSAVALIPQAAEFDKLYRAWLIWADRFTTVIHVNPSRNDVARPYAKLSDAIRAQRSFAMITHGARYYSEARRVGYMTDLGYTPDVVNTWNIDPNAPIRDLTEAIGAAPEEQGRRADPTR